MTDLEEIRTIPLTDLLLYFTMILPKEKIFNDTLFNDKFEIDFRDKIHR